MNNLQLSIKWYIDRGLVHSIHTSVRRSFRSCRRRWNWAYREKIYPRVTLPHLEFGVAFHAAMEEFYRPEMWGKDFVSQQAVALQRFSEECDKQLKRYRKLNGDPDFEVLDDFKARKELGLGMIRYYTEFVSPQYDVDFTPVRVEVEFEVPIFGPSNEVVYCTCNDCWAKHCKYVLDGGLPEESLSRTIWKGLPVTYGGRLDMLAQDKYGRYWVYDWKRLTINSPVLTPSGWSTMGELKVGDYVIGSNGKPTKVTGVYPKGKTEVYEVIFRDGTIVECSDDHAWYVKDCHAGGWSVKEAQEIANAPSYKSYAVPLPSGPVEFDKQDQELVMHPYVLGSLIGDGCFVGNELTFSSQSGETVKLLNQYIEKDTIIVDSRDPKHNSNKWRIVGPWRDKLKTLGLWGKRSGEKFIPKKYLFASIENRILLLQGLCDTDGNTGMLRFTTTSKQLADDFRHLVWSLGGNANLNVSQERLHQNGTTINVPQYGINYWLPDNIEPNQLERKRTGRPKRSKGLHRAIKEVRATGVEKEMVCIRVEAEDHLYMTNNFVLTHNTTSRMMAEGNEEATLELDDQVASYVWALRTYYNLNVAGFVYVEIRKAHPTPPEQLNRMMKGRSYSVSRTHFTTFEIASQFLAVHDTEAYAEGAYDEYLTWLKEEGLPFHRRHQITKNDKEIEQIGWNIYYEARDIIENPRVYPQPGRFSCSSCLYRQPCLGQNQGEDFEYTLDSLFERRQKHYYETEPSSTD